MVRDSFSTFNQTSAQISRVLTVSPTVHSWGNCNCVSILPGMKLRKTLPSTNEYQSANLHILVTQVIMDFICSDMIFALKVTGHISDTLQFALNLIFIYFVA